jgi:hypothetical protein
MGEIDTTAAAAVSCGGPYKGCMKTVAEQRSDPRVLRRVLLIAVVLLVIGLVVFAGLSGLAADPMTGT